MLKNKVTSCLDETMETWKKSSIAQRNDRRSNFIVVIFKTVPAAPDSQYLFIFLGFAFPATLNPLLVC